MNTEIYKNLLSDPDLLKDEQVSELKDIIVDYPYFQSARALYLKGLKNQESFKYNNELKITAAFTSDRSVLFDFITSGTCIAIQKGYYDKKVLELLDINVVDSEVIAASTIEINENLESGMVTSITDEETTETKLAEEKLEIGKPLDFSTNEKHSFQEWLQLSRIQPIVREKEEQTNSNSLNETQKKKLKLINKFIETNPKIPAVKSETTSNATFDLNKEDHSMLMTETLARIYLEQKQYEKAIQAYKILSLKYPEKSGFFADQIRAIKEIQE